MTEKILILDFGSQYTQLIARRLRELFVYCEIHPYNHIPELTIDIKGIILSGSPCSVNETDAPMVDLDRLMSHGPYSVFAMVLRCWPKYMVAWFLAVITANMVGL